MESFIIYIITFIICVLIVYWYLKKNKLKSRETEIKIMQAKAEGRFEPVSLHPHIDLSTCIGSGACVAACPEQDILGLVNGKATVINASNCVGHGACFHACPVEAITLRIGTETRGVELPHVNENYESNVRGMFIAGELGGMGLIKNSVEQGKLAVSNIIKSKRRGDNGVLDLVIIGAGPAGIGASLAATKARLNFKTLEQDTLGGTVFTFPRSKVVMTHPVDLPLHGKVKLRDTSKQELLELWQSVLSKNNITINENTKVNAITPTEDDNFLVTTKSGEEFLSKNILIAIGRRGTPRKLNIPGENLQKVAYRLLDAEQIHNEDILIVGGGDSAVESAMLLMKNNNITLSYRKGNFARIKQKNIQAITEAIQNEDIDVIFNSNLIEIKEDQVKLTRDNTDEIVLSNNRVYIFIGGELPTEFLKKCGIEIKKRFGYVMKKHGN